MTLGMIKHTFTNNFRCVFFFSAETQLRFSLVLMISFDVVHGFLGHIVHLMTVDIIIHIKLVYLKLTMKSG